MPDFVHTGVERPGDRLLSRMHIGSFWSLISETASPERAERMVRLLDDPETFVLPYGVPSLAKSDPDYDLAHGYWRDPGRIACRDFCGSDGADGYTSRQQRAPAGPGGGFFDFSALRAEAFSNFFLQS